MSRCAIASKPRPKTSKCVFEAKDVLEDSTSANDSINSQRWSPRGRPWPRGHILKSLSLALASKPQVLENCPVLGSTTALFFELLKCCWKAPETSQKICEDLFFIFLKWRSREKNFLKTLFLRLLEKNF